MDWAFGVAGIPCSFTIELPPYCDKPSDVGNITTVGDCSIGFELPPDRILGVGKEVYAGLKAMLGKVLDGECGM